MEYLNKFCILILLFFSTGSQFILGQPHEERPLKQIIFWGPSPDESDSLSEEQTEAYSDYYYYTGQAAPELRKMGIELKDTASFELRINYGRDSSEVFKREPGSIAYIFNDGKQKPRIIRYVMLSDEIISAAKDFFGINSK